MTRQQAPKDYRQFCASGGLTGAAIAICSLIFLIRGLPLAIRARDSLYRAGACGVTIAVVGVAVHSLFDFGLHITISALIFFSLLAIVAVVAQTLECGDLSPLSSAGGLTRHSLKGPQ